MKKIFTFLLFMAVSITAIQAQITSAGSGDWTSGATWVGGVAPTNTDNVTIAAGHTVTVTTPASVVISAISGNGTVTTVTTAAAHNLAVGNVVVIVNVTGAGTTYNGTYAVASVTSSTIFTFSKTTAAVTGTVSGTTTVTAAVEYKGALTLAGGSLSIGANARFAVTGTTGSVTRTSATGGITGTTANFLVAPLSSDIVNININTTCTSGVELINGSGKNHLTVASGATYTLAVSRQIDNLTLNGSIIDGGTAKILTVKANMSGTGSFTGLSTSIVKSNFCVGTISVGGVTLQNWELTTTNGNTFNLTSGMTVLGNLNLLGAPASLVNKLTLGAFNLTVGSVTNCPTPGKNYVVPISTGRLIIKNVGATAVVFPVGTASDYVPITSFSNSGTADDFGVKVAAAAVCNVAPSKTVTMNWDINEAVVGGSNVAITVQYSAATLVGGAYVAADAKLFHCNSGVADVWGLSGVSGSGPYTISASGFTSFSPFGVSSDLAVLPIKLSSFTAIKNGATTDIAWTTETELNNDFFNVERSTNGTDFRSIGKKEGAGNSVSRVNYGFIDENPSQGINYYRLKQTDFDGRFSYSKVVSVNHNAKNKVAITPKTTQGRLNINSDLKDYSVEVYNISGQLVKTFSNLSLTQSIDIDELNMGVYFLKVSSENAFIETIKITKF